MLEKPIDKTEQTFYDYHHKHKRPILKRCANTIGQVYYITKSRNAH